MILFRITTQWDLVTKLQDTKSATFITHTKSIFASIHNIPQTNRKYLPTSATISTQLSLHYTSKWSGGKK